MAESQSQSSASSNPNPENIIIINDEFDSNYFTDKKPLKYEQFNSEEKRIISIPTKEMYYKNNHIHIGRAVIFNHVHIDGQTKRSGSDLDRERLKKSLRSLGFIVKVHDDLPYSKIQQVLADLAADDHTDNDCLVVVVMSHGIPNEIYAKDRSYPVEKLWTPFLGKSCESLINKPKLFFIQACRGDKIEQPVVYTDRLRMMAKSIDEHDAAQLTNTYAIPNTADLLIMYSTFEGTYSWRSSMKGSWFIQSLCKVFEEASKSTEELELYNLLTTVNRTVAYEYQSTHSDQDLNDMKEMPTFVSTLTKTFKFRPKA